MKSETSSATNGGNFQNTLERGVDAATEAAHDTIDAVSDAATQAAGSLGVKGDQMNASGKRAVNRAENYLHEHPMASLGMAVAAGYILSRLLSSR